MNNLKTKAFSPEIYRALDTEKIISAPLIAASTANGMMAREQVRFFMDFCFSKQGENYTPVMIKMVIVNGVIRPGDEGGHRKHIREITTFFSLPLLTIIPISSLAVKNVSVDFEIELTSQTVENSDADAQKSGQVPADVPAKPSLLGKISYDSKERSRESKKYRNRSSNSSSLKVNIEAGQLPLAPGLTSLLDLYTKSIRPLEQQGDNR